MKKKKVIFVIPCYNEEANILKTYKSIVSYNKHNKCNFDVIVINDGSTDQSEEILKNNKINHINLIQNLGIGGAVQTGYKYAYENNYDIAIQFDGDGQHDVNYVEKLITPLINGEADMVIGSRFVTDSTSKFKSTGLRRLGIKLISYFIKLKTGKKIYDTTSGYRAINRKIMEIFYNDYPTEYPEPISTVNVLNHQLIVKEVGVEMSERVGGKSSISSWKNAYYMINVILSIILLKKRGNK